MSRSGPLRYFRDEEFRCPCGAADCSAPVGPHRLLGLYLDRAREQYGQPIVITSGNRCHTHNQLVGGEAKSEHVWPGGCLGADVRCVTSRDRARLLDALRLAGVTRVGIYGRHLHVGVGDMIDAATWPAIMTWVPKGTPA